jgi:hypothetical protein
MKAWWGKHWEAVTLTIMGLIVFGTMIFGLFVSYTEVMH